MNRVIRKARQFPIIVLLLFPYLLSSAQKTTVEKIIGADISFLPQLEAEGIKFSVTGKQGDAIQILKDHGFN